MFYFRPAVYLPSNNHYTVAVRCCPLLFELREREPMFALPYRMVLAVATQISVLLYDTQQSEPFGIVSNIHYTRLTDVTWYVSLLYYLSFTLNSLMKMGHFTYRIFPQIRRPSDKMRYKFSPKINCFSVYQSYKTIPKLSTAYEFSLVQ